MPAQPFVPNLRSGSTADQPCRPSLSSYDAHPSHTPRCGSTQHQPQFCEAVIACTRHDCSKARNGSGNCPDYFGAGVSQGHDDVIVMPEFFGRANDWDAYYTLLREVRATGPHSTRESTELFLSTPYMSVAPYENGM